MPKLADPRKTKEIELPSYPGSKVVIYTELLVWDQRQIAELEGGQFTKSLEGIKRCIKSWNFTDDDEGQVPTPVTIEALEKFWDADLKVLLESISGRPFDELVQIGSIKLNNSEKKN